MPNINPVDLQTLGARVTDPAQLTRGRWYAVRTNCKGTHNPLVHAQYLGNVGHINEFLVAAEDYKALNRSWGLARQIHRENSSIRTGKIGDGAVCEVFKFKQVNLAPVSPTGRMQASAPAIQNIPKSVGVRPVVANQSNTPTPFATLSTVDQFKSEIDALRARVQQKRDQIAELSEEIAGFTQAIEDIREKLKTSLEGYI